VDAGVARVSGAPPGVLAGFVMEPPVDRVLHSFPTRRSSDLGARNVSSTVPRCAGRSSRCAPRPASAGTTRCSTTRPTCRPRCVRSEEHTSELQSRENLVCRLLLAKYKRVAQGAADELGGGPA